MTNSPRNGANLSLMDIGSPISPVYDRSGNPMPLGLMNSRHPCCSFPTSPSSPGKSNDLNRKISSVLFNPSPRPVNSLRRKLATTAWKDERFHILDEDLEDTKLVNSKPQSNSRKFTATCRYVSGPRSHLNSGNGVSNDDVRSLNESVKKTNSAVYISGENIFVSGTNVTVLPSPQRPDRLKSYHVLSQRTQTITSTSAIPSPKTKSPINPFVQRYVSKLAASASSKPKTPSVACQTDLTDALHINHNIPIVEKSSSTINNSTMNVLNSHIKQSPRINHPTSSQRSISNPQNHTKSIPSAISPLRPVLQTSKSQFFNGTRFTMLSTKKINNFSPDVPLSNSNTVMLKAGDSVSLSVGKKGTSPSGFIMKRLNDDELSPASTRHHRETVSLASCNSDLLTPVHSTKSGHQVVDNVPNGIAAALNSSESTVREMDNTTLVVNTAFKSKMEMSRPSLLKVIEDQSASDYHLNDKKTAAITTLSNANCSSLSHKEIRGAIDIHVWFFKKSRKDVMHAFRYWQKRSFCEKSQYESNSVLQQSNRRSVYDQIQNHININDLSLNNSAIFGVKSLTNNNTTENNFLDVSSITETNSTKMMNGNISTPNGEVLFPRGRLLHGLKRGQVWLSPLNLQNRNSQMNLSDAENDAVSYSSNYIDDLNSFPVNFIKNKLENNATENQLIDNKINSTNISHNVVTNDKNNSNPTSPIGTALLTHALVSGSNSSSPPQTNQQKEPQKIDDVEIDTSAAAKRDALNSFERSHKLLAHLEALESRARAALLKFEGGVGAEFVNEGHLSKVERSPTTARESSSALNKSLKFLDNSELLKKKDVDLLTPIQNKNQLVANQEGFLYEVYNNAEIDDKDKSERNINVAPSSAVNNLNSLNLNSRQQTQGSAFTDQRNADNNIKNGMIFSYEGNEHIAHLSDLTENVEEQKLMPFHEFSQGGSVPQHQLKSQIVVHKNSTINIKDMNNDAKFRNNLQSSVTVEDVTYDHIALPSTSFSPANDYNTSGGLKSTLHRNLELSDTITRKKLTDNPIPTNNITEQEVFLKEDKVSKGPEDEAF